MASKKIGATIELSGEAKFKSNVNAAKSAVSELKSEMNNLKETSAGQANSYDTLTKKGQLLTKTLAAQKEQQNQIKIAYGHARNELEKITPEYQKHEKELMKQKSVLEQLESTKGKESEEYKNQEALIQRLSKEHEANIIVLNKAKTSVSKYASQQHKISGDIAKTSAAIDENNDYLEEAKKRNDHCATSIDGFGKKTNTITHQLVDMNKAFSTFAGNEKIVQYLEKASEAMQKIAGSAYSAAKELDEGYDAIIKKTGATGKSLNEFTGIADNIFGSMPADMADVGAAVGEVNTRFKSTGQELENTAKSFLQFAIINDTDVSGSIDSADRVMKIFGVDAKDTAGVLGIFTKAGQDTGISVNTLMSALDSNGATLRELGFGLESSTKMLAEFEANGVDASGVLTALRKAVINAAKDGKDANTLIEETSEAIKTASSDTEALQIATELFGTKGAIVMAQGLRDGRISLDQASDSVKNYSKVVQNTFEATLDPWDDAKIAINNVKTAGSELAGEALKTLRPVIESGTNAIKDITKWFKGLPAPMKQVFSVAGGMVAIIGVAGPKLLALQKNINAIRLAKRISSLTGETTRLTGGLKAAWLAFTSNPIAAVATAIGLLIGGMVALDAAFKNAQAASNPYHEELVALKERHKELQEEMGNTRSTFDEAMNSSGVEATLATTLKDQLMTLMEVENKDTATKERIKTIVNELNDTVPNLALAYDAEADSLNKTNAEIESSINLMQQQLQMEAYREGWLDTLEKQAQAEKDLAEAKELVAKMTVGASDATREAAANVVASDGSLYHSAGMWAKLNTELGEGKWSAEELGQALKLLNDSQTDYNTITEEADWYSERYKQGLEEMGEAAAEASAEIDGSAESLSNTSEDITSIGGDLEDLEEDIESAESAYKNMQKTALESISSQTAGFAKLEADAETYLSEMSSTLTGNTEIINNYSKNLDRAMQYVADSGDANAAAFVQYIADMGLEGASELDKFLNAVENNTGEADQILNDFAANQSAQIEYANNMAKLETITAETMAGNAQALQEGGQETAAAAGAAADQVTGAIREKTPEVQAAYNEMGQAGASGISDTEGEVNSAAETVVKSATDTMDSSSGDAQAAGSNLGAQFASGISSQRSAVTSAAVDLKSAAGSLQYSEAYTWGSDMGQNFANGLRSQKSNVADAANDLAEEASKKLHHTTPDEGPLKGDDKWGAEMAQNFAKGMNAKTGEVTAAAENLASSIQAVLKGQSSWMSARYTKAAEERVNQVWEVTELSLSQEKKFWEDVLKQTKKGTQEYRTAQLALQAVNKDIKNASMIGAKYAEDFSKALGEASGSISSTARTLANMSAKILKSMKAGTKTSNSYTKAAQERLESLFSASDLTLKQEEQYWEKMVKRAKKGTKEYKLATAVLKNIKKEIRTNVSSLSKELAKETKEVVKEMKTQRKEIKQNLAAERKDVKAELAQNIKDLKASYNEAVSARKEAITSGLSIFDKDSIQKEAAYQKKSYTEILKRQVSQMRDWDATLTSLSTKITNKNLLADLESLGPEQIAVLQQFDSMTEKELAKYEELYHKREVIATRRAKTENADLDAQIEKEIKNLKKQADKELAALNKAAAKEIKALQTNTKKELAVLRKEYLVSMKEFGLNGKNQGKGVGAQIAAGISTGFKSGLKSKDKEIKAAMKSMVAAIKKELKIKSPSQILRDHVGLNMAKGIGIGFVDEMKAVERQMQEAIPTSFDTVATVPAEMMSETGSKGRIVNEVRIYLGEKDVTDLLTKKIVKKITDNQRTANLAKGVAYV